jgi:hypothetical protein
VADSRRNQCDEPRRHLGLDHHVAELRSPGKRGTRHHEEASQERGGQEHRSKPVRISRCILFIPQTDVCTNVHSRRGKLTLKNQRPKYQITHPSGKLAESADVVLRLHYNVQPWVGMLTWDQERNLGLWKSVGGGQSKVFALPAVKQKDGEKKAGAKA